MSDGTDTQAAESGQVPVAAAARTLAVRHQGAVTVGAIAMGALALGVVALGALAIGKLAIGQLTVGRARY